jgi:uncharacterized peroxidase-related enzyme
VQAHAKDLRAEVKNDWHTLVDAEQGPPPDEEGLDAFVHAVVRDWRTCPLTPPLILLLEFAEKVTRRPWEMAETDIAGLRRVGLSDRAIHDAVQVVACFNYLNRVADALGVELERDDPGWGTA